MDFWEFTFGYFLNPDKRIFLPYLLLTLVLALFVFLQAKQEGSFWKYIFNRKVWLGASARVDYLFFLFNALIKILLIIPYLSYGFSLAFEVHEILIDNFAYVASPLPFVPSVILYTISLTITTDFAVYLLHYAMHKVPFLWEFHKVHHSARRMNPFTQYRLHPIELLLNNLLSLFVFGLITGLFTYWTESAMEMWVFLGVNIFSFIFYVAGANLRHSHVALRYPHILEYIFLSPVQHQIHHSQAREHWNKNMGSRLAIWDWLFGTLYFSRDVHRLSFGLGGSLDRQYTSFQENLLRPFVNIFRRIMRKL